jgi:TolB protein
VLEGSPISSCAEICSINVDGTGFVRLTDNEFGDLIPSYSDDDSQIFFLASHETLDIYRMEADGSNVVEIYDSGFHDSDLDCSNGKLAFTKESQIWLMDTDGSNLVQVTDPPRAGEWGNANLPFGDYDPNLSPDGTKIVFERLVNDTSSHGNYDLYVVNADGTEETAITSNGYSQGIPVWSNSGESIAYVVSAIDDAGIYDMCIINADGSNNRDINPDYFPAGFLCHDPIFSEDDSKLFFVGEWYSD